METRYLPHVILCISVIVLASVIADDKRFGADSDRPSLDKSSNDFSRWKALYQKWRKRAGFGGNPNGFAADYNKFMNWQDLFGQPQIKREMGSGSRAFGSYNPFGNNLQNWKVFGIKRTP